MAPKDLMGRRGMDGGLRIPVAESDPWGRRQLIDRVGGPREDRTRDLLIAKGVVADLRHDARQRLRRVAEAVESAVLSDGFYHPSYGQVGIRHLQQSRHAEAEPNREGVRPSSCGNVERDDGAMRYDQRRVRPPNQEPRDRLR